MCIFVALLQHRYTFLYIMKYNFDEVIERRGSGALKYDDLETRFGNPDLIPLWVADMDFATPPFIIDAISERLQHPILGYTLEPADYRPAIIDWIRSHHGWEIRPEWITFIPGVVKGIGFAVNTFLKPGEKVIIQPPVYHPFRLVPLANGREVVYNPLKEVKGEHRYEMDFENLEKIYDKDCKMLILANPHNPAGIVWDRETLRRLADFCYKHDIIVVSDEIHCDLAMWGKKHIPFASVSKEAEECSITFGAPTKTFNIAGIVSSYAIVPNAKIREKFFMKLMANELEAPHLFAPIATIAAFRKGEEWRKELLEYLQGNIEFIESYCKENFPEIEPWRPEASYLVWLDCRKLGLDQEALNDLFVNKAGLALNDGAMFGKEGEGFMRLNAAAPRATIAEALDRLKKALAQVKYNK